MRRPITTRTKTADDKPRTLADYIEVGRTLERYGRRSPGPQARAVTRAAAAPPREPREPREGDRWRDLSALSPTELLAEVDAAIGVLPRLIDDLSSAIVELRRFKAIRPALASLVALDGKPPAEVEAGAVETQRVFRAATDLDPRLHAVRDALAAIVKGARAAQYQPTARLRFCRRCRALLAPDGDACPQCRMRR